MTLEDAVGKYLDDKRQQNCAEETLTKLETLFRKQFFEWVKKKGILYLVEITLDNLEEFRKSWKDKSPAMERRSQRWLIGSAAIAACSNSPI